MSKFTDRLDSAELPSAQRSVHLPFITLMSLVFVGATVRMCDNIYKGAYSNDIKRIADALERAYPPKVEPAR